MASPQAVRLFEQIYAKVDKQVRDIVTSMLPDVVVAAQDDGTVVANRWDILNFQGPGVNVAEQPDRRRVNVYVPGAPVAGTTTTVVSNTVAKAYSLSTPTTDSYSAAVLADSPWAYYKTEETSGTSAADSSGNSRTGVYYTAPHSVAGPFTGWQAVGDGAYLGVSQGSYGITPPSFTASARNSAVEGWFRLWRIDLGSESIFDFGGRYWPRWNQSGQCSGGAFNLPVEGTWGSCTIGGYWVSPGEGQVWHHIVVSCNSSGTATLYIDGVSRLTNSTVNNVAPTSNTIYLGRSPAAGFLGDISRLAVYDHELSSSQVAAHYAAAGPISGSGTPPANWDQPGYSDSAWTAAVAASVGPGSVPSGATAVWKTVSPVSNTEEVLFRQTFALPAGEITAASIELSADDALADNLTHINGATMSTPLPVLTSAPVRFNVPLSLLTPGATNLLAFWVKNINPIQAWGAWKLTVTSAYPGTDTRYQLVSQKNQANGYAGLDSGTHVATAQLGSGTANSSTFLRGDQTWAAGGGGSLTTGNATLSSNINFPTTNTWVDVLTLSLAAGTWLITFCMVLRGDGTNRAWGGKVWNGVSGEYVVSEVVGPYSQHVAGSAIITLASTTTIKLSGVTNSGNSGLGARPNISDDFTTSNVATQINAVKVA